ncbi:MAG: hypothetical protein ACLFUS_10290, partial [Candidatus Sumerlaeia bacterium]
PAVRFLFCRQDAGGTFSYFAGKMPAVRCLICAGRMPALRCFICAGKMPAVRCLICAGKMPAVRFVICAGKMPAVLFLNHERHETHEKGDWWWNAWVGDIRDWFGLMVRAIAGGGEWGSHSSPGQRAVSKNGCLLKVHGA